METIILSDAQTRLRELLERTSRGEAFEITENGQSVGKLVPPDRLRDPAEVAAAVERLRAMSGMGGKVSKEELKSWVHEGHRY